MNTFPSPEFFTYEENASGGITILSYSGTDIDVVIPAQMKGKDVTEIGNVAFHGATIHSVDIPNTMTVLRGGAFTNCLQLETVTLRKGLNIIEHGCFARCSKLSSITLPNTLTDPENSAFSECIALRFITIPSSLSAWGEATFEKSGLETVVIENGILQSRDC